MTLYLVGYDLHPKQGETYDDLINAIKSLTNTWWHRLDSTWLLVTNLSEVQIRDALWRHMRKDDQLLVARLTGALAWEGFDQKASDWLRSNYSG